MSKLRLSGGSQTYCCGPKIALLNDLRSSSPAEMDKKVNVLIKGASWIARSTLALLSGALATERRDHDRQLHDSDLIGEYNHRTGRLDAGNDPYGWYDED